MTSEEVLLLRKRLGLNQAEMAKLLLITREYYSRIENGLKPSPRLEKQLQDLGVLQRGVIKDHGRESAQGDPTATELKEQILRLVKVAIGAATNNPQRLGWILEQVRQHLAIPIHWTEAGHASEPGRRATGDERLPSENVG